MKKPVAALLFLCLLLTLCACGGLRPAAVQTAAAPSPTPAAITAQFSYGYANMALTLPAGWAYTADIYELRLTDSGAAQPLPSGTYPSITFWPEADETVKTRLSFYPEDFGMCGTGVTFEDVTLADGLTAAKATATGNGHRSVTLIYRGTPGAYAATCYCEDGQWQTWGSAILDILGGAALGQGIVGETEAVAAAGGPDAAGCDPDATIARFDYLTGNWTVTFADGAGKTLQTVTVAADGTPA